MSTKKLGSELDEFLLAHPDTRFLEMLVTDINGVLRGKRAVADEFAKPFGSGANFSASAVVLDTLGRTFDGIKYGGRDGDPDYRAIAVPGTLVAVPWASQPTAQVLLDMVELEDREPLFYEPRAVLRRSMQPLLDLGYTPVLATELEFYLVEHDGKTFKPRTPSIPGSDLPQTGAQYGVMDDLYDVEDLLNDIDHFCAIQKIPAGAALSEYAAGQFEINLHHVDDPVMACDHAVMLKRAVKAAARDNDMAATFMAKPFKDMAGSGLHVHVSLLDADGNNVFAGESCDGAFSDTLRHAVAGLAAIMPESMLVYAPNANSYRRYAPLSYVPSTPNWGPNHRSMALRIPLSQQHNTRIEHRVAGADANPYLVVATVLAGMHHGIVNRLEPGAMVETSEEVEHEETLPTRWPRALDAFARGTILRGYFGAEFHELYHQCRSEEEASFHSEVGSHDFEWYLRAV